MRVLVVEDERGVADFIKQGLSEAGYAVDVVNNGLDAWNYILAADYDVIILDIMLPGLNGIKLLKKIRENGIKTPVLILTALDAVDDRVKGLDTGADDYLVKPFAFPELLARIRALLRRPPLQADRVLRVGDLELDVATRRVTRNGKEIKLTPKEFSLLEFLMRHPNQVLTRKQIVEHVWNFDFYGDSNVVDVYIGYLRRKIDNGFSCSLIHTIRGVGYMIKSGEKK